jgi:hypothetical protein
LPVPAPWIELGTPSLSTREVIEAGGRPRRTGTLVAVLAASVAVLLVAAVVVVALVARPQRHTGTNPAPSTTQTLRVTGDGAPTNVRLQDDQTSITVSWTDPSGGAVPFAVLGGRANEPLQLLKVLDPGTTTWTHEGVSDAYDHCYLVAAFYKADGADVAARSKQVCTHRHG